MAVLIASAVALLSSCEASPVTGTPPRANRKPTVVGNAEECPPEPVLRALHATSFHFQHGPVQQGRQHLEQARQLSGETGRDELGRVLARLSAISARITAEPGWAHAETEHIRVFFSSWRCIPDEMHSRFHEALPPIP